MSEVHCAYPCPACGFEVFSEPPGTYERCAVCGWEDDPVQLSFPGLRRGANRQSLWEWQRDVLSRIPREVSEHRGEVRHARWRPLTRAEASTVQASPRSGTEYFAAVNSGPVAYYWESGADPGDP